MKKQPPKKRQLKLSKKTISVLQWNETQKAAGGNPAPIPPATGTCLCVTGIPRTLFTGSIIHP